MSTQKTIIAMAAGVVLGAAVGILLAPEKGEVTRSRLKEKSNEAADKLEKKFNEVKKTVEEKFNETKDVIAKSLKSESAAAKKNTGKATA